MQGITKRIKTKIETEMDGFTSAPSYDGVRGFESYVPPRDKFPVPDLVLFVFRDVMGFNWAGIDEKEQWAVYANFNDIPMIFSLRKFGFEVDFPKQVDRKWLGIALVFLQRAIAHAEEGLKDFANQQLIDGNATLANRQSYLNKRYRFFRKKADETYSAADRAYQEHKQNESRKRRVIYSLAPHDIHATRARELLDQEGSFHSAAMIDAFFSRLEHDLVLLLPFIGFDPRRGALVGILKKNWGDKFKKIFDVNSDVAAKTIYDRLRLVKEKWRNPLAHGGHDKYLASSYFHLPNVGPIPVSSSAFRESVDFNLNPVEPSDHKLACQVFDDFEEFVRRGKTKHGYRWLANNFDVAFDQASRDEYLRYIRAGSFSALLEGQEHRVDQHGDMQLDVNFRFGIVSQPLLKYWRH